MNDFWAFYVSIFGDPEQTMSRDLQRPIKESVHAVACRSTVRLPIVSSIRRESLSSQRQPVHRHQGRRSLLHLAPTMLQ